LIKDTFIPTGQTAVSLEQRVTRVVEDFVKLDVIIDETFDYFKQKIFRSL